MRGSRMVALSVQRISSCLRLFWPGVGGGQPIKLRGSVEPNARELQIRLAYFSRMCLARPFDAFFGHGAVMRGRFHETPPIPSANEFR